MGSSKINWTDDTLNPLVGCSGCHLCPVTCYALKMAVRLAHNPKIKPEDREKYLSTITRDSSGAWRWSGKVSYFPERLMKQIPGKGKAIFVGSMGDLLAGNIYETGDVLRWIERQDASHRFILLSRIPSRFGPVLRWRTPLQGRVFPGFSASTQVEFDANWAAMKPLADAGWRTWASLEPLLGHIDASQALSEGLQQVIVGGESCPKARPTHPNWFRSIRDQCAEANIKYYFKQWGEYLPWHDADGADIIKHGDVQLLENWRKAKVVNLFPDGKAFPGGPGNEIPPYGHYCLWRVGKKAAGRILDGRTHDDLIWRQPK